MVSVNFIYLYIYRGEETQLSSGWPLIGSELPAPNFNSSLELNDRSRFVIAMYQSSLFAVITRLTPTLGREFKLRPKVKDAFWERGFRSRS